MDEQEYIRTNTKRQTEKNVEKEGEERKDVGKGKLQWMKIMIILLEKPALLYLYW